jgi:hypothetical protein
MQSSAIPLLIFFLAPLRLCAFAFSSLSSLRPCAFASLRFLLLFFAFAFAFTSAGHEKNQPTRGLGESADGCFLKDASERRVD